MADYKSTHTGAEIDAGIDKAVKADTNWDLLMTNLGIGRWANQTFITYWTDKQHIFYDDLAPYYTRADRMFANSTWGKLDWVLNNDYTSLESCIYMFIHANITNAIYLSNIKTTSSRLMFADCYAVKKILLKKNCTFSGMRYANEMFAGCVALEEIGEIDFSSCITLGSSFQNCKNLKSVHCKHFKVSFDISASTAFEEADLVEIISNLDTVSTAQTLTMGATNLAKLTDEEKQVATDKGWVLA